MPARRERAGLRVQLARAVVEIRAAMASASEPRV